MSTLTIPANGDLYLPPGEYVIDSPITAIDREVVVYSDAPGLVNIKNTSGCRVCDFKYNQYYRGCPNLHNLRITTSCLNPDYAVAVTYANEASSIAQVCGRFSNLTLESDAVAQPGIGWHGGFGMTNVWSCDFDGIMINGDLSSPLVNPSTRGISYWGRGAENKHRNIQINSMSIFYEMYLADSQGFTFEACTGVRGRVGAYFQSKPGTLQPLLMFRGCHFNVDWRGVICDMPQSFFGELDIYKAQGSVEDFVGIEFRAGADVCGVSDLTVVNLSTTGSCVAVLSPCNGSTFTGVKGQRLTTGYYFGPTSSGNSYTKLKGLGNVQSAIDFGVGNELIS